MRCPECGADNQSEVTNICDRCGAKLKDLQPQTRMEGTKPAKFESYFIHSIILLACCCMPFGIVALIYAADAKSKFETGRYREAEEKAAKAKLWCIIGLVGGIIGNTVSMFIMASLGI